jgi:hypothetical protein
MCQGLCGAAGVPSCVGVPELLRNLQAAHAACDKTITNSTYALEYPICCDRGAIECVGVAVVKAVVTCCCY